MDMKVRDVALNFDAVDSRLLGLVAKGLPLVPRPYAVMGYELGITEAEVMRRLARLTEQGFIRRFGVIVRHRELGYRANAMVVWDIPDDSVAQVGRCFGDHEFVTLCYHRPRRLPQWRYNLFTMIHGRDRGEVLTRVAELGASCSVPGVVHDVLFSGQRFKQRGALYATRQPAANSMTFAASTRALAPSDRKEFGSVR